MKKILLILCLLSVNFVAMARKDDNFVYKRTFTQINFGQQDFNNSNNSDEVANVWFVGFNVGKYFLQNEKVGFKYYGGLDYGSDSCFETLDCNLTNFAFGFDGLILMGNRRNVFNLGPLVALNNVKQSLPDGSASTTSLSVGANIGFLFFTSEETSVEFGGKYFIPLYNASFRNYDIPGSNSMKNVSQLYFGFSNYF